MIHLSRRQLVGGQKFAGFGQVYSTDGRRNWRNLRDSLQNKTSGFSGDWNPGWGHIPSDTCGNWVKLQILACKMTNANRGNGPRAWGGLEYQGSRHLIGTPQNRSCEQLTLLRCLECESTAPLTSNIALTSHEPPPPSARTEVPSAANGTGDPQSYEDTGMSCQLNLPVRLQPWGQNTHPAFAKLATGPPKVHGIIFQV